jgi:membrane protein YdbS with pleckstrin-like domain
MRHESTEAAVMAIKASPPVTVSVGVLAGIDMQWWVLAATLLYTVLMIVKLLAEVLPVWWRRWGWAKRVAKADEP